MIKKIISFILLISISFILFSCEVPAEEVITLDAPVIEVNNDLVYWDKVSNAVSYEVCINDDVEKIYITTYDLSEYDIGEYKIKVRAYASNTGYSDFSNEVYYNKTSPNNVLASPVVSLNGRTITWAKIKNADSYSISLNGTYYDKTELNSYTFSSDVSGTVTVISCSNNKKYWSSNPSNEIIITEGSFTSYVNILELNDTHGAIKTDDYPGMDKVATVIDTLETEQGEYIKIVNGDAFQGGYVSNSTKGRIFIDTLNELDFDCYVIGNHEFDWGIDYLYDYKDGDLTNGEANFPFLSCNIIYKDTKEKPEIFDDYVIVDNNGVKVGIIGAIQANLTDSITAEYVENIEFLDPIPIISDLSYELRTECDCDCVIVSIHGYSDADLKKLANLNGDYKIDAVVCGHTHQNIEDYYSRKDGYSIPVVQSYTKNVTVGTIRLTYEEDSITYGSVSHYLVKEYLSSSKLNNIFSSYSKYFNEASAPVCSIPSNLSKDEVGVMIAESIKEYTNADYGMVNSGGVRAAFYSGKIYKSDIYAAYPFDNKIYVVTVKGSVLKQLYKNDYSYFSSGINLVKDLLEYKIAVVDFIYTKESYQYYFGGCKATYYDYLARDAFESYLYRKYN